MKVLILIAPLVFSLSAFSEDLSKEAEIAAEEKPVASESGKNRVLENIARLNESIVDLRQNIKATQHNLNVIRAELKELNRLEREHQTLAAEYKSFLEKSESEMEKNEKTTRVLAEDEKKPEAKEEEKKPLQKGTSQEHKERIIWEADAKEKTEKVVKLLHGVEQSLKEIRSRKLPLQGQLSTWVQRMEQYQELLKKSLSKREELRSLSKTHMSM